MRLLHAADLHLGKSLNRFSLYEDQRYILDQILKIAGEERADVLLLAGDLFDRGIPPLEAVSLLDDFLTRARSEALSVYAVSGNHDSPVRLSYAARLLSASDCHIASRFSPQIQSRMLEKNGEKLRIYLLPYVRASRLRSFYESPDSPFAALMERYLEENIRETECPTLLLAHQWVVRSGENSLNCDSEVPAVGQVQTLNASLFDHFSHVALGHLHRPQQCGEHIQYAGSPLSYSASEAGQEKSVSLIEVQQGTVSWRRIPLKPLHEVIALKGLFDELLDDNKMSECEDYVFLELKDEVPPDRALSRLQGKFPRLCGIRFQHGQRAVKLRPDEAAAPERESTADLFSRFFAQESGHPLLPVQEALLTRLLDRREE